MTLVGLDLMAGTSVVEVTASVRGAFAGRCLLGLGADVTRLAVEAGGEPMVEFCNDGKQIRPASGDLLRQLASSADVIIEDLDTPWVLETLEGAGPPVVSVTGFGRTSPKANAPPGLVDAESGIMWELGVDGRAPLPLPGNVGGILSGVHAAAAAAWTVLCRRVGVAAPRHIDIAQADVVAAQLGTYHIFLSAYGGSWTQIQRPARGSMGSSLALGAIVDCTDGPALLWVTLPAHLQRLCDLIGGDFASRYGDFREALAHRDTFSRDLSDWARGRSRRQLLERAETVGVLCAPFLDLPDLDHDGILPLLRADGDRAPSLPLPWQVVDHAS